MMPVTASDKRRQQESRVETMKAFITVMGHDTVGVVAKVSGLCSELNINILSKTVSGMLGDLSRLMAETGEP